MMCMAALPHRSLGRMQTIQKPRIFEAQPHKRQHVDKIFSTRGPRLSPVSLSVESELWVTLHSTPHSRHLATVAKATHYLLANIPSLSECAAASGQLFGRPHTLPLRVGCLLHPAVDFTSSEFTFSQQVLPASASHARPPGKFVSWPQT